MTRPLRNNSLPDPIKNPLLNREQRLANEAERHRLVSRDFRTDTVTISTAEQCDQIRYATKGDNVYDEDDDTKCLESWVAELCGMEAALFCSSGTMTNQLGIRTHLRNPPYSVVLNARSHIQAYEAGGIAAHSHATPLAVRPANGHHMTTEEVLENCVFGDDVHGAPTQLVCNTLAGMIFPQDEVVKLRKALDQFGIILHCDGARMWEAVTKTGMSLREACVLCLSKGLGAPVGSVLVGTRDFIKRARWHRKQFGGGIRQSGLLAYAAILSLRTVFPKLAGTHELARRLAVGLVELGVALDYPVETQMVWIDPAPIGISSEAVDALLAVVGDLKREKADRASQWAEEVGPAEVTAIGQRSEQYARGEWVDRVPGPKKRVPLYKTA